MSRTQVFLTKVMREGNHVPLYASITAFQAIVWVCRHAICAHSGFAKTPGDDRYYICQLIRIYAFAVAVSWTILGVVWVLKHIECRRSIVFITSLMVQLLYICLFS